MAIYDCFSFFGGGAELDLLDLRLHELSPVVDKFVLVEATLTHSGWEKPLYYNECKGEFDKFKNKIIHIVVNDMPFTKDQIEKAITFQDRQWLATGYQLGDDWVRERYQRNQIMRGLVDCKPDDIIIIEDADEFIKKEVIAELENIIVDGSNAAQQEFRTYFMNWKCTNMEWAGSKILRYKFVTNPSEHRFHTPASRFIHNAGWHFNYLGGADAIREKIQAFAHQEFHTPEVFDNIQGHLNNMTDALGRLYKYELASIDDLPEYIQQNPDKFRKYMYG